MSKYALIITDGSESIQSIAHLIKEAMPEYKVKICPAENFKGTDILPADIFFIGCEKASPSSFAYLEKMLLHINFASRKCGIFSVKEKTISYLKKILKDCDASAGEPLVTDITIKKAALNKWIKGIVK